MTCGKDARDDCAGKVQIATQVQGEGTQGTCIHLLDMYCTQGLCMYVKYVVSYVLNCMGEKNYIHTYMKLHI